MVFKSAIISTFRYVHLYSLRKRHIFYVQISAITKKRLSDLNWKDQLHSVWQAELHIKVTFDLVILRGLSLSQLFSLALDGDLRMHFVFISYLAKTAKKKKNSKISSKLFFKLLGDIK